MSRRILIARKSAEAERLTSWVTIASRLVILGRPPFSLTVTNSLSASLSSVFRFFAPGDRPRGLPDWPLVKRVWRGRRRRLPVRPHPGQAVLLADASLVLEPYLDSRTAWLCRPDSLKACPLSRNLD
jgi:hypothetical protein